MEKDEDNATQLYPLSDFSPRKGEALEKGLAIARGLDYLAKAGIQQRS